jgi:hypothetical protein
MTSSASGIGPTDPPSHDPVANIADDTAGTVGHPPVEDISDLVEGLLAPLVADVLRAHLIECAECARTHDALLEIRSLLSAVEQPGIPEDVAGRIDAALAAEALPAFSTTVGSGSAPAPAVPRSPGTRTNERTRPPAGPGTGSPDRPARRRRLVRALVSAAALTAAVGFGGVLVHGLSPGGDAASSAAKADTAAGRQAPALAPHALQEPGRQGSKAPNAAGSGTTYTVDDLGPQIMQLVGDQVQPTARPRSSPAFTRAGTPDNGGSISPDAAAPLLPGCVLEATGHDGDDPVATDLGTFEGDPVGVVVYPDSSDSFEVFLIDSSCELTTPSTPGTVKLHRTLPKH